MTIDILKGKVLSEARRVGDEEIFFTTAEGERYKMYHDQECCEEVYIEDICGDLEDLVGEPLIEAEEAVEEEEEEFLYERAWTFYRLRTIKGGVTIRWCGESNGYYSVGVSFEQIPEGRGDGGLGGGRSVT